MVAITHRPVGAPTALQTSADYLAWIPEALRNEYQKATRKKYKLGVYNHLRNSGQVTWAELREGVKQPVGDVCAKWKFGSPGGLCTKIKKNIEYKYPDLHSLKQANEYYAAQAATKMPIESVDKMARKLTMQESWFAAGRANEAHRRGLVAAYMSSVATKLGQAIPYLQANVSPTVSGAGSIASAFWNDAKDWVNDKVVKPLAAIVHDAAQLILSLRATSGLLKFVLDAAGISILFSALEQTSAAVEAGDWAAFDDEAFLIVAGETLVASGTAMAVVGAVFPPLAIVAAAISAASISLGQSILAAQASRQQVDKLRIIGSQISQAQQLAAENLSEKQSQAEAVKVAAQAELSAAKNKTPQPAKKRGLLVVGALAASAVVTAIIVGVATDA